MFETIVKSLKINGWAQIPELLTPDELSIINLFFDQHKTEFVPASIGKGGERHRNQEIRGDHTFWLDPLNPPEPFKRVTILLEEMKLVLNRHLFLGLKEFECHLAYYEKGTFYKKHLDRFENDSSRVLSFVLYLNEEWDQAQGGELILFDKPGEEIRVITPMPGTFVCFLSSEFPHEVKPAEVERRSLTGWIHTKIIN